MRTKLRLLRSSIAELATDGVTLINGFQDVINCANGLLIEKENLRNEIRILEQSENELVQTLESAKTELPNGLLSPEDKSKQSHLLCVVCFMRSPPSSGSSTKSQRLPHATLPQLVYLYPLIISSA